MEKDITPERIANSIMQDKSFKGYYFIVEGKKDSKVFSKFVNDEIVRIRPAFGCEKVKRVLSILEERGFNHKIGIIDRDFMDILGAEENIDGIFITDDHDIEIMIIKTHALENVLKVCCTKNRIKEFEKSNGKTIREIIFNLGKEIGYLKLANKIHSLGLIFKPKHPDGNQFKYKNFISSETLEYKGHIELINTIINYSRSKSDDIVARNTIETTFNNVREKEYDLNQLVNGHDLSNILFLLMKKVLKSKNKLLADFNSVEDSLILAYEYSDFQRTRLYHNLENWSNNVGIYLFN